MPLVITQVSLLTGCGTARPFEEIYLRVASDPRALAAGRDAVRSALVKLHAQHIVQFDGDSVCMV